MTQPSNITIGQRNHAPIDVTVHTVRHTYQGEVVTITTQQIVLHTDDGLICIPLEDVPIITYQPGSVPRSRSS